MMRGFKQLVLVAGAFTALIGIPQTASAIPAGWTCIGSCGTLGANGVVTAPAGTYDYVTTNGGPTLGPLDLNQGSETNGSILRSQVFAANVGDELLFNFNYVTSDGAGYADYGWARLLDGAGNALAMLFSARTTTVGNTSPGFGLPANESTLTPASSPIIAGGPAWSPLGGNSGSCYSAGCGYTGWIQSTYNISAADVAALGGTFQLEFGVVNWSDSSYQSGMALYGSQIAGVSLDTPEPGSLILLGSGLMFGVRKLRRRSAKA
jgi:hypothetical protein